MSDDDRGAGFRTYTRAIDAIEKIADPALLARVFRLGRVDIVPEAAHYELPQSWREVPIYLDPARFYAGYLGVRDEIQIHEELRRDLRERVPQALLRDVHRMEYPSDGDGRRQPTELGIDPGGREAYKEARAAQVRDPIPRIEPLVEQVMAEQVRRHRVLWDPWEPLIPDDAPRNYREIIE